MFASGLTQAQILFNIQTRLRNLRAALHDAEDLYSWSSGIAAADLVAIGFTAGDAATTLSAIADANAVVQIYKTGQPPGTYPQAASAFVYAASQRQVIGPQ